jgi:hypothetical protein
MSGKNQYPLILNWQSTDPRTNFLPIPANQTGSIPSGNPNGAMASTNTIYSQIFEKSRMDNVGLEVAWSGTPTGTLTVLVSNSGINWPSLTFNPVLAQPSGSAGTMFIDMTQLACKYVLLQYTNSSGSGTLNIYGQLQDLN